MSVLRPSGTVLHLFGWDKKFVPSFIDFVIERFAIEDHRFIVHGEVQKEDLPMGRGIVHFGSLLKNLLRLMAEIRGARKVIIHGLFSSQLLYVLALQPWLLKKCYWTIWGGDLYVHEAENKNWRWLKNEWFRRFVISRIGHFITHVHGDYDFAKQWYSASGQWHECFMYPTNLHYDHPIPCVPHEGTNILLGNSATPSNHHLDALEKLRPFAGENIRIYCPLSYGDIGYGDQVVKAGVELFGEKFVPLREFMPFDMYLDLLARIDVAIFNHSRQQAMGNITTLIGMGKAIYLRTNVTSFETLKLKGISVFDVTKLSLNKLSVFEAEKNISLVRKYFSVELLQKQLKAIGF